MKKKKNIKRKRTKFLKRKIILEFILFFIVVFSLVFLYSKIRRPKEEFIKAADINYYIDIADKNTKNQNQLNWKQLAAIDGCMNEEKFQKSSEENVNNIAKKFYDEKGVMKSFNEVLQELNLNPKKIKDANELLETLKDSSLASKYQVETEEKKKFINDMIIISKKNYTDYKVLPSITVSQAILESNWGKSELSSNYYNYFGIKADKSWKGKRANFKTKENYNDVIYADFRAYQSMDESVLDYGKFLNENSRYKNKNFFQATNYIGQANALQEAGYATAKDENGNLIYAKRLINIIREYNLMLIDNNLKK